MNITKCLVMAVLALLTSSHVLGQEPLPIIENADSTDIDDASALIDGYISQQVFYESLTDSLLQNVVNPDTLVSFAALPKTFFLPAVYHTYRIHSPFNPLTADYSGDPALRWLEDLNASNDRSQLLMQRITMEDPKVIPYNIGMLPEPPKQYEAVLNPNDYTIDFVEQISTVNAEQKIDALEINKRHWIKAFTGNLQFSQAYVSPNWYQGGNNNLNMLLNLNYNFKLNQKYHPNYLFETNVQYKLGMNSAPDDTIRSYNISEDIFQVNSTFGIKAVKKWYYTITAQFKTQLLESYTSNTRNLRAAFLSPAELNAGIGMTYNTSNEKKTFTFDASISPLSYNLMICRDNRMNKKAYGIEPDKNSVSKYGSSIECKLKIKITDNISLQSRLFGFTDYSRAYADLENTMVFEINKYLTTQIFAHLRYDTNTPYIADAPDWHKLQVKEILSMGFTYKFSTI